MRALHVYERYGLIAPRRTEKGWRLYGRQHMALLNIITALKAIGLSLSQIQDIVRANPPSLDRVLELQVETWRSRKAEAEHGLALAEAVLAQIQARQFLAMEDLCDLVLNFETSGLRKIVQDVLNDQFAPADLHNLGTWAQENWSDGEVHADAFIKSRTEALKLLAAGSGPSSAEAQDLIERVMTHERNSSVFERGRAGVDSIFSAAKGEAVAKALMERISSDPALADRLAVEIFIDSARQVRLEKSDGWQRFVQSSAVVVAEAHRLVVTQAGPDSPEASAMLDQFTILAQIFTLGDPVFYALWAHEKGPARKNLWEFIGRAERVRRAACN